MPITKTPNERLNEGWRLQVPQSIWFCSMRSCTASMMLA